MADVHQQDDPSKPVPGTTVPGRKTSQHSIASSRARSYSLPMGARDFLGARRKSSVSLLDEPLTGSVSVDYSRTPEGLHSPNRHHAPARSVHSYLNLSDKSSAPGPCTLFAIELPKDVLPSSAPAQVIARPITAQPGMIHLETLRLGASKPWPTLTQSPQQTTDDKPQHTTASTSQRNATKLDGALSTMPGQDSVDQK